MRRGQYPRVPTGEDERRVRMPKGPRAMHKYLDTWEATLFEGVVDCKGSELQVGGKEHSNIVEFVTIEYSVTAVEVTEVNGHLQVNKEILPGACTLARGGCELEDMTLVINKGTVDRCRYV